jgi:hypothetical protein
MIGSTVIAVEIPADLVKVSRDRSSTGSRFLVSGENLTCPPLAILAIPPCARPMCVLTLSPVFLSDTYSAYSYVKVWIKRVVNYHVA